MRPLLPALAVPSLVLHREGDRFIRVGAGRYLAQHIPGAKYVELPGGDQLFFLGDTDVLLDEIEDFLTGRRQAPEGDVVATTIPAYPRIEKDTHGHGGVRIGRSACPDEFATEVAA